MDTPTRPRALPAIASPALAPDLPPLFTAIERGRKHPLGATVDEDGVNFALYAPEASAVELLLFDAHDAPAPAAVIALDPETNRSFQFWHCHVRGLAARTHYAYRVHGPAEPGTRFDRDKVLIDPYARGLAKAVWQRGRACVPGDNVDASLRAVVIDERDYDWQGDRPLNRPMQDSVIYELHVGGFTRGEGAGVSAPGTFRGVVEKIPYLKALGVTAVELLPVFAFEDSDAREVDGRRLTNYWGYSTMAYFAPHAAFCEAADAGEHAREFRDMVKALHAAGIEVILDVVFNHTDEGNHQGPVYSFKGLANSSYYYLTGDQRQFYYDYTGCGNTFNTNHPFGQKFITDCLRHWVEAMHVDGFRFDEGSVLSRGEDGAPLEHAPVLWQIELDETLADTKLIAEAWDAAGLYQIGRFPGQRWAEWNGRFRDHVRRFARGDAGEVDGVSLVGQVASRLCGSPDLYQWNGRRPVNSVNFVACHDGFTLRDLVSFNGKHNEANGEGNRDGIDDNLSWNCGAEGTTDDAAVNALRERQTRNFAAILLLSQGVPMILMGDEVGRSQRGNNNAWCQDNPIGWFDWQAADQNSALFRFWARMIAFRKAHPAIHRARFANGVALNPRGLPEVTWHGTRVGEPDWSAGSRTLAVTLAGIADDEDVHILMNMWWEPLDFELPQIAGHRWHRAVDTALASPADIADAGAEPAHQGPSYRVEGRSVVVLVAKPV